MKEVEVACGNCFKMKVKTQYNAYNKFRVICECPLSRTFPYPKADLFSYHYRGKARDCDMFQSMGVFDDELV